MFDIGFSELVLIGIVALVVLGPKRLPEVASAAGRWAGKLRRFVENVKRDMDSELRRDELAELRKVQQEISDAKESFQSIASNVIAGMPTPDYLLKGTTENPVPAAMPPPLTEPGSPKPEKNPKKTGKGRKPALKRAAPQNKKTATARPKHGRSTRKR